MPTSAKAAGGRWESGSETPQRTNRRAGRASRVRSPGKPWQQATKPDGNWEAAGFGIRSDLRTREPAATHWGPPGAEEEPPAPPRQRVRETSWIIAGQADRSETQLDSGGRSLSGRRGFSRRASRR